MKLEDRGRGGLGQKDSGGNSRVGLWVGEGGWPLFGGGEQGCPQRYTCTCCDRYMTSFVQYEWLG